MRFKSLLTTRTVLVLLVVGFLAVGLAASGAFANGPLNDDTEEPCLGGDDPWCSSSEDDTGGGSSSVDCEKEYCRDCPGNTLECKYVGYAAHCSCTATHNTCSAEDTCNVKK